MIRKRRCESPFKPLLCKDLSVSSYVSWLNSDQTAVHWRSYLKHAFIILKDVTFQYIKTIWGVESGKSTRPSLLTWKLSLGTFFTNWTFCDKSHETFVCQKTKHLEEENLYEISRRWNSNILKADFAVSCNDTFAANYWYGRKRQRDTFISKRIVWNICKIRSIIMQKGNAFN